MLLFESEFVHIVAISFTSLILTELLMVALTVQTWHWLMIVGELLSLACYIASLVFLHEFIGEQKVIISSNFNHVEYGSVCCSALSFEKTKLTANVISVQTELCFSALTGLEMARQHAAA
ncbi:hypothetical protein CHARACLAT_011499 [Characodon lateralis]|uniref:Uncharacterized protein n=1 Tax=Characodon lateralis TaxID=208331 RepID=A0ABU7DIQ6_9TELE|nr:hypothetical protein [Characodon lateralis]